ncbi:MAG: hypothetical protein V2A79_09735 [Planctomycetota bacterium]
MADVLNYPGLGANAGVPGPYLQGLLVPAGPGFGGQPTLGMGRMTRRFADIVSVDKGGLTEAQLQALIVASAQAGGTAAQSINFNYYGSQGPPGPPGLTTVRYVTSGAGLGAAGPAGAAGADAFDDIDIPIPYDGFEGGFTNNSPIAGSVAWISFKVKYQGTEHVVAAGNTANAWLYWDVAAPTVLSSAAAKPSLTAGQFVVGYNNGGTFEQSQFIKLITAGFISVNVLSAIVADLGTMTAGTITLNLGTVYRLRLSPNGLQGSINSGVDWFNIISQDGTGVLIQGDRIKAGTIETDKVADNAVSNFEADTSAAGAWVQAGTNILSVADVVVPSGFVRLTAEVGVQSAVATGLQNGTVSFRRGVTQLKAKTLAITNGGYTVFQLTYLDQPAAATYTYSLRVAGSLDDGTYENAELSVELMKK